MGKEIEPAVMGWVRDGNRFTLTKPAPANDVDWEKYCADCLKEAREHIEKALDDKTVNIRFEKAEKNDLQNVQRMIYQAVK